MTSYCSVKMNNWISTVGEKIIATMKMRNDFCLLFKNSNFSNIRFFSFAPHLVIDLLTLR